MYNMLEPTFIKRLRNFKNILIVGAGGGFDVFCGLPLFFALREVPDLQVHLANLSFSFRHGEITGKKHGRHIVEVDARSKGNDYYFPEGYLSQWLCRKRMDKSIYCIRGTGVADLQESYETLHKLLGFDTMVLVDGGVDSIMRGDETRIGTPVEDMASLAAAMRMQTTAPVQKQLLCLGLGAETDLCQIYALETIAHLIKLKAFLGGLMLGPDMPEVQKFADACEFVFFEMRGYESVICSSILSALDGHYGDYHRTRRTLGTQLHISPLMLLYLAFDVTGVAQNVLYFDRLANCESLQQIGLVIKEFRSTTAIRKDPTFPPIRR